MIYAVANNGFFEGKQNEIAIGQIKIWSEKINAKWGQGIGIGSGEMLPYLKNVPLGKEPIRNLGEGLENLCENILSLRNGENIYGYDRTTSKSKRKPKSERRSAAHDDGCQ